MKGICTTTLDRTNKDEQQKIDKALDKLSKRFYTKLSESAYPEPSWFMLIGFRISRTSIKKMLDAKSRDYNYYAEKGWFESDYFYPTRLRLLKKVAGRLFDAMAPTILKMFA